jgi:hypothetical protein
MALGLSLVVASDVVHTRGSVFAFWAYLCQIGSIAVAGLVAQRVAGLRAHMVLRPREEPA